MRVAGGLHPAEGMQEEDAASDHHAIQLTVTAIANFEEKRQYEEVHWNGRMLQQVLRESQCEVCVADVSMNKPDAARTSSPASNSSGSKKRWREVHGAAVWPRSEDYYR